MQPERGGSKPPWVSIAALKETVVTRQKAIQ